MLIHLLWRKVEENTEIDTDDSSNKEEEFVSYSFSVFLHSQFVQIVFNESFEWNFISICAWISNTTYMCTFPIGEYAIHVHIYWSVGFVRVYTNVIIDMYYNIHGIESINQDMKGIWPY